MAPFGKLYGYTGNPRTTPLLAVAKANGLDVELVTIEPPVDASDDYRRLNKLGKIPTFEGADGYVLTEVIAIAVYLTSQNEKTTLLGKTKQDYASILRWLSFANTEVLPKLAGAFRPLLGKDPYNKRTSQTLSRPPRRTPRSSKSTCGSTLTLLESASPSPTFSLPPRSLAASTTFTMRNGALPTPP